MNGISMKELREVISYWHDAEFVFGGTSYVLQPEKKNGKNWLVIWDLSTPPHCICRHEIPEEGDIPLEIIDAVLSEKCFSGKSFFEIEKDVTVTVVF